MSRFARLIGFMNGTIPFDDEGFVGLSTRHSKRMFRAAAYAKYVAGAASIMPTGEWQLRPLAGLDFDQRSAAWSLAVQVAKGRHPTRDMVAYAAWHVRLNGGLKQEPPKEDRPSVLHRLFRRR